MKRRVGIYIHIPFCRKKCNYCDFLSFPLEETKPEETQSKTKKSAYLKALCEEIRQSHSRLKDCVADTVFIGGGTPSLLSGEEIEELFDELRSCIPLSEDAELSMEMNPGTARPDRLAAYRRAGINRVSVGLQSACDKELELLGRIHTFAQFEQTYAMLRESGFSNLNVDIMSALPFQSMETYAETLERVAALKPEHISAYSLIVEPGTPFYDRFAEGEGQNALPDEETDRRMYAYTTEYLKERGYHRYEISNYARDGFACRHNLKYWQMEEYIGFGLGSASYFGGKRYKNTEDFGTYLSAQGRDEKRVETALAREEEMEEFMFLGLRTMRGVPKKAFYDRFGVQMCEVYGSVIDKYVQSGLLVSDSCLRLTDAGIDVSNTVMADFLLSVSV